MPLKSKENKTSEKIESSCPAVFLYSTTNMYVAFISSYIRKIINWETFADIPQLSFSVSIKGH